MREKTCNWLGFILLLFALLGGPIALDAKSKPNIIFILTDDQGYGDLACHGHPFLKTPNLDKLYLQSLRFMNYHVSPTCAPTRAALMSGLDAYRGGVTHTILERERLNPDLTTVAEVLKKGGYSTGIFGKWHLGDADEYQPDRRGFDEVFIHGAGGIGQNFPGTQGAVPGTGYYNPIIRHNNRFVKTEGYCTDVFFKQGLGWIKMQKESGKPFFAFIPTNAPHAPFLVADAYEKPYEEELKKRGLKVRKGTAAFFGMITNIDDNMGILMKKLDQWKLSENTIVIYMTDNGSARGSEIYNAQMKAGKGSSHEGGTRVPFILRWPGVAKVGSDVSELTRHFDLFPTLAQIAGVDPKLEYELSGRSLLGLIKGESVAWPDRKLFVSGGRWPKKGAPGRWGKGDSDPDSYKYKNSAVRTKRWRLIGGQTLYDIQSDPGEAINVAEKFPEVAAELKSAYDNWWESMKPYFVNDDAALDTGKPFIEAYEKQKSSVGIPNWKEPEL